MELCLNKIEERMTKAIVDGPEGIQLCCRNAIVALLAFDITRAVTLEALGKWAAEVKEKTQPTVPIYLVANKADLVS
jgi:GTPase SAR1 family protein